MRATTSRVLGPLFIMAIAMLFAACTPKYPKCKKDSHCEKKGEVCVEGLCQQCRDTTQCEAGQVCKGGRCEAKAECARDTDCAGGKVCKSGQCKVECSGNSDCGAGLKCKDSRCVDKMICDGPSDCESGTNCVNGRCTGALGASRGFGDQCPMPNVEFDFNVSTLSGSGRDDLAGIAECIKSKGGTVTIEGHCDERGTEEYNLALGEDRARAVRNYLLKLGVPRSKLRIISKGELEPVDEGQNESAWAKNRRAQFVE